MERNYEEEFISWLQGMDKRIKYLEKYIQDEQDKKDIEMAIGKIKATDKNGGITMMDENGCTIQNATIKYKY